MDDIRLAVFQVEVLLEKAMGPLREAFIYSEGGHATSKIAQAEDEIKRAYVVLRTWDKGRVVNVEPSSGPSEFDYKITYEHGWIHVRTEDLFMYLKRWE